MQRHQDRVADEIRWEADRVCAWILYSDLPLIDVQILAANLRRRVQELAPGEVGAFERVYMSRFRRLWEQWRGGEKWS